MRFTELLKAFKADSGGAEPLRAMSTLLTGLHVLFQGYAASGFLQRFRAILPAVRAVSPVCVFCING